tara:strand:- start:6161 stop:6265 length:105 start_codon:yes stop_codon:yes gene_type:complete
MTKDEKFLMNVFISFVVTMGLINFYQKQKNKKNG